jgi:short chain dehydrogenase
MENRKRPIGWPLLVALTNGRFRVPDERLDAAVRGKVILVTGSSYGIGEATARRLARAGATVLQVARTADRLEAVAEEIRASGGRAHTYPTSLADPAAIEQFAATVLAEHGHVDVLVSNAGRSIRRSVAHSYQRFHDFERTNAVNYLEPAKLGADVVAVDPGAEVGPPRQGVDRGRVDSPDGTLVGEAIVSRAHNITPSFVRPVDAVGNLFRVPTDLLMRQYFRRTERVPKPEETP